MDPAAGEPLLHLTKVQLWKNHLRARHQVPLIPACSPLALWYSAAKGGWGWGSNKPRQVKGMAADWTGWRTAWSQPELTFRDGQLMRAGVGTLSHLQSVEFDTAIHFCLKETLKVFLWIAFRYMGSEFRYLASSKHCKEKISEMRKTFGLGSPWKGKFSAMHLACCTGYLPHI